MNKSLRQFHIVAFLFFMLLGACGTSDPSIPTTTTSCSGCNVFITNSSWTGNIGSKSNADIFCSTDSNNPNDGTYKAMLVYNDGSRVACTSANCSTGNFRENVDWVLGGDIYISRSNRSVMITRTSVSGIIDFPLVHAFSDTFASVWTGLNANFTTGSNCNNWQSSNNSDFGYAGIAIDTSSSAISFLSNCDVPRHLICVQQ